MQSRFLIMTVGMNHSGKTTFSRSLKEQYQNIVILENDQRRTFAEGSYPVLRSKSRLETERTYEDPDMKTFHIKAMMKYSSRFSMNICLANCNTFKKYRKKLLLDAKELGYQTIIVYFDVSYDVLLERARIAHLYKNPSYYSGKIMNSDGVEFITKGIVSNLEWMKENFEAPDATESDYYFCVKHDIVYRDYLKIEKSLYSELIEKIGFLFSNK